MDGGAWQAAVHGVTKSRTQLSDFTFMHWRKKWQPTPVFLPGESQGWGSLVDCHLWSLIESTTTEATQQQQHTTPYPVGLYTDGLIMFYLSVYLIYSYRQLQGSPGSAAVKNLPANAGNLYSIPGWEDPCRRKWLPIPVFLPGKFHGQRNLVGHSLWGCRESYTTERPAPSLSQVLILSDKPDNLICLRQMLLLESSRKYISQSLGYLPIHCRCSAFSDLVLTLLQQHQEVLQTTRVFIPLNNGNPSFQQLYDQINLSDFISYISKLIFTSRK